ncbi:MAG: hypothetical protein JSS31_01765 [Proteobacteria bacterium]|nr:hypothetical protein [Pseudomonadota bacterium]MBS0492678.1 hypothetical protein [Pseudomonadota bacterium]
MSTRLHRLIAAKANTDPAVLISTRLLTDLLTRRLQAALAKYVGFFQTYPDSAGVVQIGITNCTYAPASAGWNIVLPPAGAEGGQFFFESTNPFSVQFSVTKTGDSSVDLFSITLDISKVSASGVASYRSLSIGDVNIDFSTTRIPAVNRTVNAAILGLSELDIARLEGLVEGSVAPTAVNNIFSGSPSIDLHSLFPAVVFNGQAEVAAIVDGLLIIARDGWHLDEAQRCHCASPLPDAVIAPLSPTFDSDTAGTLPVQAKIPPPRNPPWPVETNVATDVALYLPQSTIREITSGPYPAINDFANDNGFIGWMYDYTIGFFGATPTLSDSRATIVLSIDFYVTGSGSVSIDVPCIGRSTVGMLWATNRVNGASTIEIGITPRLQPDGKIVLTPEILSLQIEPFKVDCIVIALSLLSYFGPWGTFSAFVINEIIRRVIAHNLPPKLNSGLRDAMGKQMWTLLDLAKLDINAVFDQVFRLREAVSRDDDSLLIGLAPDRG